MVNQSQDSSVAVADAASLRHWLVGLGLLALLIGLYLLFGEKPWETAKEIAERAEVGRKPRTENYVAIGFWWAALANLILTLVLLAFAGFWSRRLPGSTAVDSQKTRPNRWFWFALAAVVILGGALRWNLANRSLWWDELWSAKFAIVGYYLGEPEEPVEERRFAEPTWQRSIWYYSKPTNHGIASFPARISHRIWKKVSGVEDPQAFSDLALRIPTFLVSLATLAVVAWLGLLWRRPWTGLLAALLLAIHPWHVRYGIDMRAYSYLVLWTALGCVWLTQLAQRERVGWLWWGLFGFNQFLIVWSFPVAGFVALGFFVGAAVIIFRKWREKSARVAAFSRLVFVNALAGMLWIQFFSPNVPQLLAFMEADKERHLGHEVSVHYLREAVSRLATGLPWDWPDVPAAEALPDLADRSELALQWVVFSVIGIGVIAGAARLGWRDLGQFAILAGPIAAAAGILIFFWITKGYFYPRFLIFLLIPFVWLLAEEWTSLFPKNPRFLPAAGAALLVITFGWLAWPQLKVLTSRPYEPLRDIAENFENKAKEGNAWLVGYGHGVETLPVYLPGLRIALSKAELDELMAQSQAANARLFVVYGHNSFNRHQVPDGFERLDDPAVFREIDQFAGIEPWFFYRLLEFRDIE